MERHHKDYLNTFNEFMNTVKKDMKAKFREINNIQEEKEKNENILLITADRDFFRQEAIRLNNICIGT